MLPHADKEKTATALSFARLRLAYSSNSPNQLSRRQQLARERTIRFEACGERLCKLREVALREGNSRLPISCVLETRVAVITLLHHSSSVKIAIPGT